MKRMELLAAAVIIVLLAGCQGQEPDTTKQRVEGVEPQVPEAARQCWTAIQNAVPRGQVGGDQVAVWTDALLEVHKALWNLEKGGDDGSSLRYIVDQFGKHGPQLDFLLLFGDPYLTVPMSFRLGQPLPLTREADGILWADFQEVRDKVCRYQVERFLADPEALRRYCDAVLWWARMVRTNDVGTLARSAENTKVGFESSDSVSYWWCARQFLVLACLTERLDLLKKVDAIDLRPAFSEWHAWLQSDRQFKYDTTRRSWVSYPDWLPLRNDDNAPWPKKPFDDWGDLPSPPLGVIIGYTEKMITY